MNYKQKNIFLLFLIICRNDAKFKYLSFIIRLNATSLQGVLWELSFILLLLINIL